MLADIIIFSSHVQLGISRLSTAITREKSSWTLEEKFHILARPCIILYIILLVQDFSLLGWMYSLPLRREDNITKWFINALPQSPTIRTMNLTSMTLFCLFIPPKVTSGEEDLDRNLVYWSSTHSCSSSHRLFQVSNFFCFSWAAPSLTPILWNACRCYI